MGEFNANLLKDLASLADPKGDNSMTPDPTRNFGFSPEAIKAVEVFKNALFKAVLLRAHNCYIATHQKKLDESERSVVSSFEIRLTSASVHPKSEDAVIRTLGVIPSVYPGQFDGISGGIDLDDLISGFNSNNGEPPIYTLACK